MTSGSTWRAGRLAVASSALVASLTGCALDAPPLASVHVANLSPVSVAVHAEEPGGRLLSLLPFRISGSTVDYVVRACSEGLVGLPMQDQQITIRSVGATYGFVLHAPGGAGPADRSGDASIWIVVRSDGAIERTSANAPPHYYCPGSPRG